MKSKRIIALTTVVMTLLSSTAVFADANQGKIINGRTMIPLRGAFTDLGFEVSWDGTKNTATLKDDDHVIKVKQGDKNFTVDGVSYKSDVAPTMINGSIYIPLRSIGDTIGAEVNYDADMEIASMFYDDDYTYIYIGTLDKLSRSSYGSEGQTVYDVLTMEDIIIDEFNEALDYADEGDYESAIEMFEVVKDDCNYLITNDFDRLSTSIQDNIVYFATYTVYAADSCIIAMDSIDVEDYDTAYEELDYAEKYILMANLYYQQLGNFYNNTYVK